jgi:hypothetical protein
MQKIPVTLNSDHNNIIGYLHLDDTISLDMVLEREVSWSYRRDKNELLMMTLVPKPKVVIENSCGGAVPSHPQIIQELE